MAVEFEMKMDNRDKILKATKEQIEKALEECGLVAEGYAKQNLTKNKSVKTGALKNSVTHEVDMGDKCVYIGSNLEYAPYVELGTGVEYAGGRRTSWTYKDSQGNWHMTKGSRAKPYLKPAIDDNADKYRKIIDKNMKS